MASEVRHVESVRMALAELAPADYNPRKISAKAMAGLKASLTRFGELGGIVYNKRTGHLVGGHQRVKALLALGETHAEVRVVDLPVAEEKAANLALNHPGIGGEWDDALLAVVLDEIKRDLPTAFEELQLADIIADAELADDAVDDYDADNKADQTIVPLWAVLVECEDETEQVKTIQRLIGEGFKCRAL
jgi:ParB-like chromosome segregation protein Spo0J